MSFIAALSHNHVFGISSNIKAAVHHIDESTIAYCAGSAIVLHNIDTKLQKIFTLPPSPLLTTTITCLAVNNQRKIIAIGEKQHGALPLIHIYDYNTLRKKKTITPTLDKKETSQFCVSMSFSKDGKHILLQFNNEQWSLIYYSWEKLEQSARLEIAVLADREKAKPDKSTLQNEVEYVKLVESVHINQKDESLLSVSGHNFFRILRLADNHLKPTFLTRLDINDISAHIWTKHNKVVLSTDDGNIHVVEPNGDVKHQILNVHASSVSPISSLCCIEKGFIAGDSRGIVAIYHFEEKKNEDEKDAEDILRRIGDVKVPTETSTISHISVSPTEDNFVCTSLDGSVIATHMNTLLEKADENKPITMHLSFHRGPILSMSICVRKPLVVTISTDCTVRIWNYVEKTLEFKKHYQEEIYSVSIHPSGLYLLVSFADKLRMMNVLLDDLRSFKEFNIRACKLCKFSSGGQYFAILQGNVIQIYSTWTFACIANLKGHNGKVKSLNWSLDDAKLVSAGVDGAVYVWSLLELGVVATTDMGGVKREGENIIKSCIYSSAICTIDTKNVFAVGNDKILKKIVDSQIAKEYQLDVPYSQIVLSNSNRVMLAGTVNGTIRAIKYPIDGQDHDFQDHVAHSGNVTYLGVSHDDQYLFSIGEDGCLFMYKIDDKEQALNAGKEFPFTEEILITRAELDQKTAHILELKTKVEELKLENEYQLRLKDMNFGERVKQVTERFQQELDALKITNILKAEKEKEEMRHHEEANEERDRHAKSMNELDTMSTAKLMAEYEKIEKIQLSIQNQKLEWQKKMDDLLVHRETTLSKLQSSFEQKLLEKQNELETLHTQMAQHIKEFEETIKETEEDADMEILHLKQTYEIKLQQEKETGLKLKGENAIMKKKFNTLQSEIDAQKTEINKLSNEEKKLNSNIKGLEKDLASLKKEIRDRDEAIQDKEKRIFDLKKKNQELEKFKFVLDHKIKELKKQIEPREQDIQGMIQQIKEMDDELQQYGKDNTFLSTSVSELKLKIKAADIDITNEREKWKEIAKLIKTFKIELNDCVSSIQVPKELKTKVRKLFHKFCLGEETKVQINQDAQFENEYHRHRIYLEKSLASMKQKVAYEQNTHSMDTAKMIRENTILIKEINEVRKEVSSIEAETGNQKTLRLPHLGIQ